MKGRIRDLEHVELWRKPVDGPTIEQSPALPQFRIAAGGAHDADKRPGFWISFTVPAGSGRTLFRVWVPAEAYAQVVSVMTEGAPVPALTAFASALNIPLPGR